MGTEIRPRPELVAELTRGVTLPIKQLNDEHIEVLSEGLRCAFAKVSESAPDFVASGTEPELTALMQARLNSMINEDALWGQLVLSVGRGSEIPSFDGSHLEKRPDLSITLTNRDARFPLVIEAKILDRSSSKTISLYCRDGIRRFVDGEYAWGSCEAFMIGYVRDGSTIDATLREFLSRPSAKQRYLVEVLPVAAGSGITDFAYTRHGRNFAYVNQPPPNTPGPISIWHLWLG